MNDKNKKIIIILSIFTIIFTLMGGTLSYWNWSSDIRTGVTFTMAKDFSCSADGGQDLNATNIQLQPTADCTNPDYALQRTIKVTPDIKKDGISINLDLWLKVNRMGSGLTSSNNFMYAISTVPGSCKSGMEGYITGGNFKGIIPYNADYNKITLFKKTYSVTTTDTYYLYIWLDAAETNIATANQTFDLSLGGQCTDTPAPEAPVLDSGMIPVTISNDGTVTIVSEDNISWYSYNEKKWANVVLVEENATSGVTNSHSRSYYQDPANVGKEVTQADILAYYVWIPRYKYRILKNGTNDVSNTPETIDIEFETKDEEMVLGNATTEYRSHPAFWWNHDNDTVVDPGEMVAGIWVGKFESSPDESSVCSGVQYSDACDNATQNARILPNSKALRYQDVSNQFATSQNFSKSGNIYGLDNSSINAHMMKNSEWGAVAYLSHSKYGINQEININYNPDYYTGSSSGYFYPSFYVGYKASSTTGNVTGVYDMTGGSYERVMGHYDDINNNNDMLEFTTIPEAKYYDSYSISSRDNCTLEECGGHALDETAGWYNDTASFVNGENPWFIRGGVYSAGPASGVFHYSNLSGGVDNKTSWRSVLVPGFGA